MSILMTISRVFAGRISKIVWRSRKQVMYLTCLLAGIFLLYIQLSPSSSAVERLSDAQLRRSLNSFGHPSDTIESRNSWQKVRFLPNENANKKQPAAENAVRQEVHDGDRPPLFREDTDQGSHSDAVRLLEQRIREQNYGGADQPDQPPVYDRNPVVAQEVPVGEPYLNDAVPLWAGAAARFNPYGEPIYEHSNRPNYIPKQRVVHIDLKGAPPLPSVFKILIPWLAKYGATDILLEYEDMFPYDGPLATISAKNHYSKKDVKDILAVCKENNIEVIPLLQTFGHLEHVLKGRTFSYLREVRELPQALCPSKNESALLVRAMIDQMMALHPDVKYLHIGCDEVYQIGECEQCRQKMHDDLFLEHVASTAKYVRKSYRVIPLIWHDMLSRISNEAMKSFHFGQLVEPMVWVYAEDIYRFVQPTLWSKFAEIFPHIWVASAFKGAFGEQSTVPNVRRHLDNNLNWLDVMDAESPKFPNGIRGLVLTGWQRFDHFAVLCEVLPAAMPSLAMNLIAVSHGFFNETLYGALYESLSCVQNQDNQNILNLDSDPFLWDKFSWCFFPGALTFKLTSRLASTRKEIQEYINRVTLSRAWITDYNRRHNFSSPMRIDEDLEELPTKLQFLLLLIKSAKDALSEWFDGWTVGEWIEQHIWPLYNELSELRKESESMKEMLVWPARPLPLLKELGRFGITEPPIKKTKKKHGHVKKTYSDYTVNPRAQRRYNDNPKARQEYNEIPRARQEYNVKPRARQEYNVNTVKKVPPNKSLL